jgi:hypothetical protein
MTLEPNGSGDARLAHASMQPWPGRKEARFWACEYSIRDAGSPRAKNRLAGWSRAGIRGLTCRSAQLAKIPGRQRSLRMEPVQNRPRDFSYRPARRRKSAEARRPADQKRRAFPMFGTLLWGLERVHSLSSRTFYRGLDERSGTARARMNMDRQATRRSKASFPWWRWVRSQHGRHRTRFGRWTMKRGAAMPGMDEFATRPVASPCYARVRG